METKKVLFFDIDGTVISDITRKIPESACRAISKAKENGHYLFVNTGRTMSRIVPELKELPFDGFLCGCGIYLTYHGEVFFYKTITDEQRCGVMKRILECNIDAVFENSEKVYYFPGKSRFDDIENLKARYIEEGIGEVYDPKTPVCYFDKIYVNTDENSDVESFINYVSEFMDVTDRENGAYECVPKGCSKATAMDMVYQKFGIEFENSYAFGDSSNDLPMFENAAHNIAMGVHSSVLEPYTEFVTKNVENDGLEYAMRKYKLI